MLYFIRVLFKLAVRFPACLSYACFVTSFRACCFIFVNVSTYVIINLFTTIGSFHGYNDLKIGLSIQVSFIQCIRQFRNKL